QSTSADATQGDRPDTNAAGEPADDQADEHGDYKWSLRALAIAHHRRWQRFAVDQFDQYDAGFVETAGVVVLAEMRREIFADHPAGDGVGNRAFQTVAD